MAVTLRELLSFFVEFERQIIAEAAPGIFQTQPRSTAQLLDLFRGYFGGPIRILGIDVYDGIESLIDDPEKPDVVSPTIRKDELASFVLMFYEDGAPKRADIIINVGTLPSGEPIFNRCYRRFLAMKEAFHVILRHEFLARQIPHPDADNAVTLLQTLERLIYLPFAIIDFDDPEYTDDVKIEHAAELLAILIMYPLDAIEHDRTVFLQSIGNKDAGFENPDAIATRTLAFADQYKVPQRYVDLLFRWQSFSNFASLYRQLKAGY